jgi:acetyl esterase
MTITRTLDPATIAWCQRIGELTRRLPALRSTDLPKRRAAERTLSDMIAEEFTAEPVTPVSTLDLEIPTRSGPLFARRYRPAGPGPLATQLFLHGGGFIGGTARELVNDRLLRARTAATGIQFISLDYRLAPEHPYPAAVNDTIAALDWMRRTAAPLEIDSRRIGIGGVSAGAGVVASTLLRLRDEGRPLPVHQVLEVPAVSLNPIGDSAVEFSTGYGLEDLEQLRDLYVGTMPIDAYASPLELSDLSGMPRTLVMTAEFDPLRDGAEAYAARLEAAAASVILVRGEGHLHGTPSLTRSFAGAREWQRRVADELRAELGRY